MGNMETFRIAQIADLHLDTAHPQWEKNARRAIIDAYAQKAGLVIFSGDVVNTPRSFVYFQRLVKELRVPYRVIPGNHECGLKSDYPVIRNRITAYRAALGHDHWVIQGVPRPLVGINSNLLNLTQVDAKNEIRWLEAQLAREDRGEAILFMHHAPALKEIYEPDSYWTICRPRRINLFQILKRYEVQTVFHGHLHYYCTRFIEGIQIVSAPSTAFPVVKPDYPKGDSQLGYLIIDISEEEVSHKRIIL